MPMTHSGAFPIKHYYPGGFGATGSDCSFVWTSERETFPGRIFELQKVGTNKCIEMYIHADYMECSESARNGTYVPPAGANGINSSCCQGGIGPIKYAVVGGEFPPSLYLDIDTGYMMGFIDEIEKIAPEKLGVPPNFKFDETNYVKYAKSGLAAKFIVRAFDSGNTAMYNDTEMTMNIQTNWSSRRDKFILNIENQFYLDQKPVSNEEFVKGMKRKGYYPGPGCE